MYGSRFMPVFVREKKHHLLHEVAWSNRQARPSLELVPALVSWICISAILCFVSCFVFFPATFCLTVISRYPDIWSNLEKFHAMLLKMKNISTLNFIVTQQPEYPRL